MNTPARRPPLPWLKPAIWAGGYVPLLIMLADLLGGQLGANPLENLLHQTGKLALLLLLLSLSCTPLRIWARWAWPARIRRELGLLAFIYAALHLALYLLDQGNASNLAADITERPFITVGAAALLLLLPAALTSSKQSVRQLGFRRWQQLHWLVYPAALLAALHFYWGVKGEKTAPLIYAGILAALLLWRLWRATSPEAAAARSKRRH